MPFHIYKKVMHYDKEIAAWSLYAAFLGALLAGAVKRTTVILDGTGQQRNIGASGNERMSDLELLPITGQDGATMLNKTINNGLVLSATSQGLTIQLTSGQALEVSSRAWRYAQSFGFTAQAGDTLLLEGIDENGHFEIVRMVNERTAQSVMLRDNRGQPLWKSN